MQLDFELFDLEQIKMRRSWWVNP